MAKPETTYLLHANRALADEAAKRAAREAFAGAGSVRASLGEKHTTAADLAVSLWELWGDGRAIVGDAHRLLKVYGMLAEHGLQVSVGTARQVAAFLKRHLASLQGAGFEAPGLTRSERSVCDLARAYCRFLDEAGMVETGQALPLLGGALSWLKVRAAGPLLLDDPLAAFYEGVLGEGFDAAAPDAPATEAEFVLLRPEGVTAVEGMVLDEVRDALSGQAVRSVALVAPNPLETYGALAPALRRAGAACALEAIVPLRQASFGRFFLSACRLLGMAGRSGVDAVAEPSDDSWVDVATDVALSPYGGVAPFESALLPSLAGRDRDRTLRAEDLNTVWRADRLLCADDAASDLAATSAGFQAVQALLSPEGDAQAAFDRFRDDARRLHSGAQAAVEEAAVSAVRDLLAATAKLQCPPCYLALFAGCLSLKVAVADDEVESEDAQAPPFAFFTSIDRAACLAEGSFDEVVLGDVSDACLNAREEAASTDALAAKFGLSSRGGRMERSRLSFASAARAASVRFVCVFAARDAASEVSFASFAFDEFVEGRFEGSLSSKQVTEGMPAVGREELPERAASFLEGGVRRRGEERFVAGVGRELAGCVRTVPLRRVRRGELERLTVPAFLRSAQVEGAQLPRISASAIEAYLGCPYKWFLERVVDPRTLDEGFGPLEAGNLAHALLEAFYEGLRQRFGAHRADAVPHEDAAALFAELASAVIAAQPALPPNSGRYVPATNVEALASRRLADEAWRSIMLQRAIPHAFGVAATEYSLGGMDASVPTVGYAGFALDGKVDRIDVDAQRGVFAVIDYKGATSGHAAGDTCVAIEVGDEGAAIDPASLPRHVQALIYAQALRRYGAFGNSCAAALYTSYHARSEAGLVTGSYPAAEDGIARISDAKSCVRGGFDAFLDMMEAAIAERLRGVASSQIPAEPSCEDACRHCCAAFCERGHACR